MSRQLPNDYPVSINKSEIVHLTPDRWAPGHPTTEGVRNIKLVQAIVYARGWCSTCWPSGKPSLHIYG